MSGIMNISHFMCEQARSLAPPVMSRLLTLTTSLGSHQMLRGELQWVSWESADCRHLF